MKFNVRNLFSTSALIFFQSIPASAQSDEVFAIQMRLKQEGHYSGKVDGINGVGTRNALEAYSKKHGLRADLSEISGHIIRVRVKSESIPPDDILKASVHEYVRQNLKDPGSAQFRNDFTYHVRDTLIYCAEVNAKNSYGGYSGFEAFQVSVLEDRVGSKRIISPIGNPFSDFSATMCRYGVSALSIKD